MKEKKLTEQIKLIIRNDIPLRKKIGEQLGIEQDTVRNYASQPKREKALTRYPITIEVIKKHTGLKENQILM
jgi:hypothetical protein